MQRGRERGAAVHFVKNGRVNRFAAADTSHKAVSWLLMASAATFSAPTWPPRWRSPPARGGNQRRSDCSTQRRAALLDASGCENLTITLPCVIQHHRFGVGGASHPGNDELLLSPARVLLGHSVSWNREDEEYLPPSPASVRALRRHSTISSAAVAIPPQPGDGLPENPASPAGITPIGVR